MWQHRHPSSRRQQPLIGPTARWRPARPEHPSRPRPEQQARPPGVRNGQGRPSDAEHQPREGGSCRATTVGASASRPCQEQPGNRAGRRRMGRWNWRGWSGGRHQRVGKSLRKVLDRGLYAGVMARYGWPRQRFQLRGSQTLPLCAGRAPGRTGCLWLSTCCSARWPRQRIGFVAWAVGSSGDRGAQASLSAPSARSQGWRHRSAGQPPPGARALAMAWRAWFAATGASGVSAMNQGSGKLDRHPLQLAGAER